MLVVRLHNGEMDFRNDSRRYLNDEELESCGAKVDSLDIHVGRYVYDTVRLAEIIESCLEE